MTLFRRISDSAPIVANQPPVSETSPSQPQEQNRVGIAGAADLFDNAVTSNFQEVQFPSVVQTEALSSDVTVEASSMFSGFERSQHIDNRLPQLNDKLNSLEERKRGLITEIEKQVKEREEVEKAANAVEKALASDDPIPDEVLAMVGSLGILGIVGGLPLIPVLSALGLFGGLTAEYKSKAKEIKHELERKAEEKSAATETMTSDMESVDEEIQECLAAIEKEKLRLEREARPAHERINTAEIVKEPIWQDFQPDQTIIQNESNPISNTSNPILPYKINE